MDGKPKRPRPDISSKGDGDRGEICSGSRTDRARIARAVLLVPRSRAPTTNAGATPCTDADGAAHGFGALRVHAQFLSRRAGDDYADKHARSGRAQRGVSQPAETATTLSAESSRSPSPR